MIFVEDWVEVRRLHRAERMPIRAIARHLGISKNTVKIIVPYVLLGVSLQPCSPSAAMKRIQYPSRTIRSEPA